MRSSVLCALLATGFSLEVKRPLDYFLAGMPENIALGRLASGKGTSIAPQFTASITYNFGGVEGHGEMVYDAHAEKFAQRVIQTDKVFGPDVVIDQTAIEVGSGTNASTYQLNGGQCMTFTGLPYARGFSQSWGWLAFASKTGQDKVGDKTCDIWSFTPPPPHNQTTAIACLVGDLPLYSQSGPGGTLYSNVRRSVDHSILEIPSACKEEKKPCGSGKIVKKTIYVAHPENNYNISGQDVANAKGDAVFICSDQHMWTIGNYKLLSTFELSWVDSYSQYTNFPPPGNRGFGGDGYHVGRETPMSIGRHGGQCEDEDGDLLEKLGSWYSLPRGGQCIDDRYQLGVNCSWRIERRINTIEMDCLFHQQGMLAACRATTAPFEDVTGILTKSLSSEDITKGGCPAVKTPQCKVHPACAHLQGDCCPHHDGTMLDCCNQVPADVIV